MAENQDNNFDLSDRYGEKYSRYSDAEIISILKKRHQYQPEATRTAIGEAIKRGIIHSEQDLFSDEFRPREQRFTLFPVPENDAGKQKLIRSILRVLIIAGMIPLIQGFMKLRIYETSEGILLISSGLVWITFIWLLHKTRKNMFFYFLFALILGSVFYTVNHFTGMKHAKIMDVFVSGIIHLLVVYFLTYIYKTIISSE